MSGQLRPQDADTEALLLAQDHCRAVLARMSPASDPEAHAQEIQERLEAFQTELRRRLH